MNTKTHNWKLYSEQETLENSDLNEMSSSNPSSFRLRNLCGRGSGKNVKSQVGWMAQRKLSSRRSDNDAHRDYGNTHTMLARVPDRWDFSAERGK